MLSPLPTMCFAEVTEETCPGHDASRVDPQRDLLRRRSNVGAVSREAFAQGLRDYGT